MEEEVVVPDVAPGCGHRIASSGCKSPAAAAAAAGKVPWAAAAAGAGSQGYGSFGSQIEHPDHTILLLLYFDRSHHNQPHTSKAAG